MSAAPGEDGDGPARRVLERLLRRAEAARAAGDPRPASLPMDGKRDGAEYLALRSMAGFEAFHACIALAERAGAITVERARHRDDGTRLRRLTVADPAALARELGVELLAVRVAGAASLLAPWTPRFPVLEQVLDHWRDGRKIRGCGPEAAPALADAARAVQARRADAGGERILRRESVRLFGSGRSKHLESLTGWLELLVAGDLAAAPMEKEHVWAALDLRREPQPLLLAGPGTVVLDDGSRHALPRSWLGFATDAVRGIDSDARALLTIENLASFHEAAAARGATPLLLLYTGGMPSPAWRRAYACLLDGLPPSASIHHWGDIDEGGFRIAAMIAAAARGAGRTLLPWRMRPDELPADIAAAAPSPSPAALGAMCRWATEAGWDAVAQSLRARPLCLEQESLDPLFPDIQGVVIRPLSRPPSPRRRPSTVPPRGVRPGSA